jgi:GDP-L-fucose synthase
MKKINILITGHKGLVGSTLVKYFKKNKKYNVTILENLNLKNFKLLNKKIKEKKIEILINAAAKTGGILLNSNNKIEMLEENFLIQNNVIKSAFINKVKKIIFLGSSCIYPKNTSIPIKESSILTGKLEETNEGYALAKITGIRLCNYYNQKYNTDFRCVMPCNLYGLNDKFDVVNGHVIPSLIKKFLTNNKTVQIWGSGKPLREFLHVDDLCEAINCIINMSKVKFKKITKNNSTINIGSGKNISIKRLAHLINKIAKKNKRIIFDITKPDGVFNKILCCKLIKNNTNWKPKVSLKIGLKDIISKKILSEKL